VASLTAYLWLRCGRRFWSLFINRFFRNQHEDLPKIQTLQDIESILNQVKWKPDTFGDWIQAPELTWGLKRGDCEDCATLAMVLLQQIGLEGYLLSVILSPSKYSHAVCVFSTGGTFNYFSNGLIKKSELRYIEDIARSIINGHKLICWSIENHEGKIIKIKRGL
jgi:hypothetical protein